MIDCRSVARYVEHLTGCVKIPLFFRKQFMNLIEWTRKKCYSLLIFPNLFSCTKKLYQKTKGGRGLILNKAHFPLLFKPNVFFVLFTDVSPLSLLSKNLLRSYLSLRYFGLVWVQVSFKKPAKETLPQPFLQHFNISLLTWYSCVSDWVSDTSVAMLLSVR
jgi:hypothetical protein